MQLNKSQLYPALCLVTSVIVHFATAQSDVTAIENVIKLEMEKFELKMSEILQAYLEHQNSHVEQEYACQLEFDKVQNISNAQHKKVMEKVALNEANGERIAEAIKHLRESHNNLLAGQSNLQKQLSSSTKDLKMCQSDVQNQLISLKDDMGQTKINVLPSSCASMNSKATNTYYIRPYGTAEKPFLVLCDFEDNYGLGGGWTVFQNRFNGSQNFYQNWTMYRNGFGDVNGEHWLGLEKLHAMTKTGRHELLVLLEDFEGNAKYALYDDFKIGSEADKYKLTVGKYSGTAGDSMSPHNGMKFSTFDQQNDLARNSCAKSYTGAWWFNKCYFSHLNGKYYQSGSHLEVVGVSWQTFKVYKYSLKSTKMMFRSREK